MLSPPATRGHRGISCPPFLNQPRIEGSMRWQDGRYLQNYWTEKPVIACGRQANWRRSITRGCFVPTWLDSWPQHGTLGTQVTVEKLLHQTKLTKKKSWGFSIGIADWKVIGQDLETLEKVIQSKMNGTRRVSFLGQRGCEREPGSATRSIGWLILSPRCRISP